MYATWGIFGQICLFYVSGSTAAIGIVLLCFFLLFLDRHGVKKWKWKEWQILYVRRRAFFSFFSFISYFFFHVQGFFFFLSAKQDGTEEQLFMVFHLLTPSPPLSPFLSLSLSPSLFIWWKQLGMKITWTTIALCVLNIAEVWVFISMLYALYV